MNRFENKFSMKGEAKLTYGDGEYQIVSPGEFVCCAVSGQPIPLDGLLYWSVELQEAYASAEISFQRHCEVLGRSDSS
jgi:hypothetical protein